MNLKENEIESNEPPPSGSMEDDWEDYSNQHGQFYEDSVSPLLAKHLASGNWRVLLDVGCGDGGLLHALKSGGWLRGKEVLAVDISESRVAAVQRLDNTFRCVVDDACSLSQIEDSSVDVLASLQVIEHVPNDQDMVAQLRRVLTEGGIAYVTTVYRNRRAWYFYRNAKGETVIDPTHAREYKDSHLLGLFARQGFEIVDERKTPILKPVLGFFILGRLGAERDILLKHPLLRLARKVRYPVPGYYYWEIVARKKKSV